MLKKLSALSAKELLQGIIGSYVSTVITEAVGPTWFSLGLGISLGAGAILLCLVVEDITTAVFHIVGIERRPESAAKGRVVA